MGWSKSAYHRGAFRSWLAQRWIECRLAQKVALDIEEYGPERRVKAVRYLIARVHDEIRLRILQNAGDDGPMHIVPRARPNDSGKVDLSGFRTGI